MRDAHPELLLLRGLPLADVAAYLEARGAVRAIPSTPPGDLPPPSCGCERDTVREGLVGSVVAVEADPSGSGADGAAVTDLDEIDAVETAVWLARSATREMEKRWGPSLSRRWGPSLWRRHLYVLERELYERGIG